jgi:hypothetical protein
MKLRRPLITLALAGGAFGLTMGIGLAVASAATTNHPTTTVPSSSGSTSTTTHPCPNMGGSSGSSSSSGTAG